MPRFKLFVSPQRFYKSYVNPLSEMRLDQLGQERNGSWETLHTLVDDSVGMHSNSSGDAFKRLNSPGSAEIDKKEPSISSGQEFVQSKVGSIDYGTDSGAYLPYPFPPLDLELHTVREESESGSTPQSARPSRVEPEASISWRRTQSREVTSPIYQLHLWEDASIDVDPAPPWSNLSNRNLMCRPLPIDVGRCHCYILREKRDGMEWATVYSLHTDEGRGRSDRKLAIARHRFRGGRSEFIMAQAGVGSLRHQLEDGYIGSVSANIIGTRYRIWDKDESLGTRFRDTNVLLGVVAFEPCIRAKYKRMRVFVPKYNTLQLSSNSLKSQHIGLVADYKHNTTYVHRLYSPAQPKKDSAKKDLDVRERLLKTGCKIKTSAKNIQLTLEGKGQQIVLLLGKTSKTSYIMEYRYPLTAQQAFGICLASIDSKPYWRLLRM